MGQQQIVESVTADQLRADDFFPDFSVGDTINVHYTIVEGEKERVQIFQGVLIGRKGRGVNETITVRRIVANEGVERIFPLHSPRIAQIFWQIFQTPLLVGTATHELRWLDSYSFSSLFGRICLMLSLCGRSMGPPVMPYSSGRSFTHKLFHGSFILQKPKKRPAG
ncbi:MAG TPA: 50S ribosomal protein L19 [Planctomycetaceae bacterium]|nr:50S ribosomal protein L19 [Planctomycetaceae bacterium]